MKTKEFIKLLETIDWETEVTLRWIEIVWLNKKFNSEWEVLHIEIDSDWIILDKWAIIQDIFNT